MNIKAQNLIPNGDFEYFDSCPTTISTPGDSQLENCFGWYSPNFATSDYFNTCATWPVSVPNNAFGNRTPNSGNAYCGILIENCTYPSCNGWWVEYIQTQLSEPLESNKTYVFSCFIALSNKYYQYSFSEFGVNISNTVLNSVNEKPFNVVPTLINPRSNYLNDTINWMEFKSTFVASGGEEYITLGFFIDTTNIDTLFTDSLFDPNNFSSYYFIDNCSLIESDASFPNVFTPNNDGNNDVWIPFSGFENIVIINRWGNKIKQIEKNEVWNGTDENNVDVLEGVYFFIWKSKDLQKTGYIQLIR